MDENGGLSCTRLVEDSPHKQKKKKEKTVTGPPAAGISAFFFVPGQCLCSSSLASSVKAKPFCSSHKSDVKGDVETGLHDASYCR